MIFLAKAEFDRFIFAQLPVQPGCPVFWAPTPRIKVFFILCVSLFNRSMVLLLLCLAQDVFQPPQSLIGLAGSCAASGLDLDSFLLVFFRGLSESQ